MVVCRGRFMAAETTKHPTSTTHQLLVVERGARHRRRQARVPLGGGHRLTHDQQRTAAADTSDTAAHTPAKNPGARIRIECTRTERGGGAFV